MYNVARSTNRRAVTQREKYTVGTRLDFKPNILQKLLNFLKFFFIIFLLAYQKIQNSPRTYFAICFIEIHISPFQNFLLLFLFLKKNLISGLGVDPPPHIGSFMWSRRGQTLLLQLVDYIFSVTLSLHFVKTYKTKMYLLHN